MVGAKMVVAACFLALAANAQPTSRVPRIGVVAHSIPLKDFSGVRPSHPGAQAFMQGLEEFGWRTGENIEVLWRTAEGRAERLPELIEELVRIPVDVLVTSSGGQTWIAMSKTRRIPIVMQNSADPVGRGMAKSLAHPGGNVTGLTDPFDPAIDGKRLSLLKEVFPRLSRVAVLADVGFRPRELSPGEVAVAKELGIDAFLAMFDTPDQIEATIESAVRKGANGMIVGNSAPLNNLANRAVVQREAIRHRLPVIYSSIASDEDLMTYGTGFDNQRRSAYFVNRILRGANPGDIPIERQTSPRLVINVRAAKAIGVSFPQSVMIQADRVIQ